MEAYLAAGERARKSAKRSPVQFQRGGRRRLPVWLGVEEIVHRFGAKAPGSRCVGTTPSREHPAIAIVDAGAARARLAGRTVTPGRLAGLPPQLGHVGAPLAVEHEMRRASRVGPFRQVLAVGAEDLDA